MRIRVSLSVWVIFIGLLSISCGVDAWALKCDRIPDGAGATKSPADGRFRIRIQGNPERYIPQEVYTINLVGIRSLHSPHKFTGFMLQVENDGGRSENVGLFQLMGDTLAKFSERCPNLVTHTSAIPKTDIQVRWTAPPAGSGCVVFRATVIEHRDVWYMDDGPLSKMFCEEESDSIDIQPRIEQECCACQEAKYEVTFEGLWSRHTHPKDYPSNRWLTRFSDIIGASHTIDYRFWEYGQQASEGLQQVAEHGSTRQLESELKSESDHIRTIIKARGIAYPNVTGKTFAVFRVDSRHHLVSLVSQIDPSPDWIVGVSGLELCLQNCSWIDQKTLNLYPWDAGTDSGPSYTSPDQPTHPKDVIRRIKSDFPNDPRSPFYDPNGQDMKPMAKIYFTRQRLYDKNCEAQGGEDERNMRGCEVGPWSSWGPCSSACGKGERLRQREYVDKMSAIQNGCKRQLTARETCQGSERHCDRPTWEEETNETGPECALTEWTDFSECSVKCGQGVKVRTREYVQRSAKKKCERSTLNPPILQQTMNCHGPVCGGDITERPDDGDPYAEKSDEMEVEQEQPNWPRYGPKGRPTSCVWSEWSIFSSCNRNCDQGRRMRYRYPIRRNLDPVEIQLRATDVFARIDDAFDYRAPKRQIFTPKRADGEFYEFMRNDTCFDLFCFPFNDPCAGQDYMNVVDCDNNLPSCKDIPPECFQDPDPGNCRSAGANRWYYDRELNSCGIFFYGGCGGNGNNFLSLDLCLNQCKFLQTQETPNKFDAMVIESQRKEEEPLDCVLTSWERSSCSVTCGVGVRRKSRRIITEAKNGGKPCPRRLVRNEMCRMPPCERSRTETNPSRSWGTGQNYY